MIESAATRCRRHRRRISLAPLDPSDAATARAASTGTGRDAHVPTVVVSKSQSHRSFKFNGINHATAPSPPSPPPGGACDRRRRHGRDDQLLSLAATPPRQRHDDAAAPLLLFGGATTSSSATDRAMWRAPRKTLFINLDLLREGKESRRASRSGSTCRRGFHGAIE